MTEIDRNTRRRMLDAFKVRFHDNEKSEGYDDRLMAALEEALKAREASELPAIVNLTATLKDVREAIVSDKDAIVDTVWMPENIIKGCTVVDYIDMAIETMGRVSINQDPAGYVNRESLERMEREMVSGISIQREPKKDWFDVPLYKAPPQAHDTSLAEQDVDAMAYRFWSIHPKELDAWVLENSPHPEGYKGGMRAWFFACEIRKLLRLRK